MSQNNCRLCNSSNTRLTSSINDEIIVHLIDFVPHLNVDLKDTKLPKTVCQLCYGKAKISYDFLVKIQQTQEELKNLKSSIKNSNLKITNTKSLFANEVIEKIQKVGSISIKKVSAINESVNDVHNDDLIEEYEMLDEENCIDDNASSDDDFNYDGNEEDDDEDDYEEYLEGDEESDDNYEPNGKKRKLNDGKTKGNDESRKKGNSSGGQRQKFSMVPAREIIIDAPINYSCGKCKSKFPSFEALTAHMKAKDCQDEEFSCNICNKVFKTKKNLYAHLNTHKPKEKFICEVCAKEYNHQFDLESHMESVHHRVVKRDCIYRCTHCEEKFNSHLDLLEHVKEHQREKKEAPRLCEICAKVCANLKAYQSHIVIHKEKKAHTCIHCGKGFAKAFLMTQHMHIHTGIKGFTCEICNKSYAKRDSLRIHKKRDHPELMISVPKFEISTYLFNLDRDKRSGTCIACEKPVHLAKERVGALKRTNCPKATLEEKKYFAKRKYDSLNLITHDQLTNQIIQLEQFNLLAVEAEAFKDFVKALNPSYASLLPCAKTLSGSLLDKQYNKCSSKINDILNSYDNLCLITDSWTKTECDATSE